MYRPYLVELLTLFADKGIAIQANSATVTASQVSFSIAICLLSLTHILQTAEQIVQLATLLLPIDALTTRADFSSLHKQDAELVALFRNMWFLCVLFRFTSDDGSESGDRWQGAALSRIATRTPPLVEEEAHDYATSDLEYNTVFRQDYAHGV